MKYMLVEWAAFLVAALAILFTDDIQYVHGAVIAVALIGYHEVRRRVDQVRVRRLIMHWVGQRKANPMGWKVEQDDK